MFARPEMIRPSEREFLGVTLLGKAKREAWNSLQRESSV